MNRGLATGGLIDGSLFAMPTIFNIPVSFLGGGIDQDDIMTGQIRQVNYGHAEGGDLK